MESSPQQAPDGPNYRGGHICVAEVKKWIDQKWKYSQTNCKCGERDVAGESICYVEIFDMLPSVIVAGTSLLMKGK